ncbi:MAG: AAA family ATPase [Nitrospira sp.]
MPLWPSSVEFVSGAQKEIEWLIDGVLPKGAVVLLSGREGSMKSFVALSMASAVATGKPWLGNLTKQGKALYLDGEMPKPVMQDRVLGFGAVYALGVRSWTDPAYPYDLTDGNLRRESQECSLIVVDALRRHMDGLKENSSDDMAKVTKALRELTRHGATVVVLHHAPKDSESQDYRGSTELGAGVDITLSLTMKETKGGAVLTLKSRKTRYGAGCRLEIEAKKGHRVPVFTIQDRSDQDSNPAKDLHQLALLVNTQRELLGHDPNRTTIIKAAEDAGLGGRARIEPMLDEGDGVCWRRYKPGREVLYAPPGHEMGEPRLDHAVDDAAPSLT